MDTGRENKYRGRRGDRDGENRNKSIGFDKTKSRKRYDDGSKPSGRDSDRNRTGVRNGNRSQSGDRSSRVKPKSTGRRLGRNR